MHNGFEKVMVFGVIIGCVILLSSCNTPSRPQARPSASDDHTAAKQPEEEPDPKQGWIDQYHEAIRVKDLVKLRDLLSERAFSRSQYDAIRKTHVLLLYGNVQDVFVETGKARYLNEALKGHSDAKRQFVRGAGKHPDNEDLVKTIRQLMRDEDWLVRLAAMSAFIRGERTPKHREVVEEFLADEPAESRGEMTSILIWKYNDLAAVKRSVLAGETGDGGTNYAAKIDWADTVPLFDELKKLDYAVVKSQIDRLPATESVLKAILRQRPVTLSTIKNGKHAISRPWRDKVELAEKIGERIDNHTLLQLYATEGAGYNNLGLVVKKQLANNKRYPELLREGVKLLELDESFWQRINQEKQPTDAIHDTLITWLYVRDPIRQNRAEDMLVRALDNRVKTIDHIVSHVAMDDARLIYKLRLIQKLRLKSDAEVQQVRALSKHPDIPIQAKNIVLDMTPGRVPALDAVNAIGLKPELTAQKLATLIEDDLEFNYYRKGLFRLEELRAEHRALSADPVHGSSEQLPFVKTKIESYESRMLRAKPQALEVLYPYMVNLGDEARLLVPDLCERLQERWPDARLSRLIKCFRDIGLSDQRIYQQCLNANDPHIQIQAALGLAEMKLRPAEKIVDDSWELPAQAYRSRPAYIEQLKALLNYIATENPTDPLYQQVVLIVDGYEDRERRDATLAAVDQEKLPVLVQEFLEKFSSK